MDLSQENGQRKEFEAVLFELGKSQTVLQNPSDRARIYQRLEGIYWNGDGKPKFRHFYSDIFSILVRIKQDGTSNIEILGQNLYIIRNGYQAKNKDADDNVIDISDCLKKLSDHVNLDIARLNYTDKTDRMLLQEDKIQDIVSQVSSLENDVKKVEELKNNLSNVENKLNSVQKEYVAILGIFASIVLAFTGGIAFSTSILQNMHQSSIYRVVLVALLVGLILVNIIYVLFYYIDRLVRKKDEVTIKPLIIINAIIIGLLLLTVVAWSVGIVEKRNEMCLIPQLLKV